MKYEKSNYGEVGFNGRVYQLTSEADYTSRLMPYKPYHEVAEGEEYFFEMSASAIDDNGDEYTTYWEFADIKGFEIPEEEYDYDNVANVAKIN